MNRRGFFGAFVGAVAAMCAAPVTAAVNALVKKPSAKMYSECTIYHNGMESVEFNFGEKPFVYTPIGEVSGWSSGDVIGIKFDA